MITFRLKAPKARVVKLAFGEGKILVQEMKQRPDGVWETTIGPVAPGEYEYKFEVDGLKVLDYGNPSVKAGTEIYCNTVDVPGDRIDTRDLTGSEVDVISYRSSALGTYRRASISSSRNASSRCCTCGTAAATTSGAGGRAPMPTRSWTTPWRPAPNRCWS